MAKKLYDPVGKCIYCGESELPEGVSKFGDEHVVPLALGGELILPESSCRCCEAIINSQIEAPILSGEWGYLRSRQLFPTRNKRRRKTYIKMRRKTGGTFKMPVSDYSAPVPLYKFSEARILNGVPPGLDHLRWKMGMITDEETELAAQQKYPEWDQRHRINPRPDRHARFLAKIAHSYAVGEMGVEAFHPLVLDIILGKSDDYYYTVGGSWEMLPPGETKGHTLQLEFKTTRIGGFVIVNIRLFCQLELPGYHVVVGAMDFQKPKHVAAFEKYRLNGKIVEITID